MATLEAQKLTTLEEHSDMRIALFIDIENLVRSAETIGLPTDIGPILEKLQEYGHVQIRRSYGDLEKNIRDHHQREHVRKMLHNSLVRMEDIPYITQNKNTADIQLVVEALSLAYQDSDIDCFAIVASDRDYVPLFNRLREMGRSVIGIGIDRDNMNAMFLKACDRVFYYESLFEGPKAVDSVEADEDLRGLTQQYYELLGHAIQAIEKKDQRALGTRVAQMMRHLRSDFDPTDVGCTSFKRFVQKAEQEGIVRVTWPREAGDFEVSMNPNTPVPEVPRARTTPGRQDPKKLAAQYRRIIEGKQRVPVLPLDQRRQIIDALADAYNDIEGDLYLRDWSEDAYANYLSETELDQSNVFKTVLGLYFARCFRCHQTQEQFNPLILGLVAPPSEWENKLHFQYVRTIKATQGSQFLSPEAVSIFLFDDIDHVDEADRLIEEVTNSY